MSSSTSKDENDADEYGDIDTLRGFVSVGRLVVEAEHAAELESLSVARERPAQLERLRIADTSAGVGGMTLLALAQIDGSRIALTARELAPGDSVQLLAGPVRGGSAASGARGVVWRLTDENIVVSIDDELIDGDLLDASKVRLVKLASDVTYQRQVKALDMLSATHRHPIADALFGVTSPSFDEDLHQKVRSHLDAAPTHSAEAPFSDLNDQQKLAVCVAVSASSVAVIHGPPGTGKTKTLAASIHASVRVRGERVLACAPSNVAADTLLERLVAHDPSLRVVRVGNPARLSDAVLDCHIDELLSDEHGGVGRQIQRDISVAQRVFWRKSSRSERVEAREQLRSLRKEQRKRERDATLFIVERADVIISTLAGAFDKKLAGMRGAGLEHEADARYPFHSVFIDEAANALEPMAWCAMMLGRRCIVAGDDRQLPPTLVFDDAELRGVARDLTAFRRARSVLKKNDVQLLQRQYRMHEVIGQFSSECFYGSNLIHDGSCATGSVERMVSSRAPEGESGFAADFPTDLTSALIFIDTAGLEFYETSESGLVDLGVPDAKRKSKSMGSAGGRSSVATVNASAHPKLLDVGSRLNEGEAGLALAHVQNMISVGVRPSEIACISPYSAQVRRLRELLDQRKLQAVECGSVDAFQGREKEVIVFSATRSSEMGGKNGIGFLAETRRFNVALTRAKKSFTLIGDSGTLASSNGHPILQRFIEYVERRTLGDYRSGFSYPL